MNIFDRTRNRAVFAPEGGEGGDGGNTEESWRDELNAELQVAPALQDVKSFEDLAKGYIDLKAYQGSSVRMPGDDASDEDKSKFREKILKHDTSLSIKPNMDDEEQSAEYYKSIGRPSEAAGYSKPQVEVPDDVTLNEGLVEAFRATAHKHGLSQKQFEGIIGDIQKGDIATAVASNEVGKADLTALADEWGAANDRNTQIAKNTAESTGAPPALLEALKAGQLDATTTKWLHKLGEQLNGKGQVITGQQGGAEHVMTPGEAQSKVNEIMGNQKHAYWNISDPEHQGAKSRVFELTKLANPKASHDINDLRAGRGYAATN